jgi:hypothetical protein
MSPAAFSTALIGMGYTQQQANDLIITTEFKAASAERNRATRSLEKRYVAFQVIDTDAQAQLAALGWPQGVIAAKLAAWNGERAEQLTSLTVAQIEKALKAGALTAAQAAPLLADLGEDAAAIATIIGSNTPSLSVAQIEADLKAGTLTPAQATTALQSLGLPATAIAAILAAY